MFAVSGILFNHESPRRGETFVTRKIAMAVADIKFGLRKKLYMGNLDAQRDWGFAPEYVDAMWRMLQADKPEDYVIGTGEMHSVREFLQHAFARVDLDWQDYVELDPRYLRPAEVDALQADPSKAHRQLGWSHRTPFQDLVRLMVDAEMESLRRRRSGVLEPLAEGGRQ
jgi:GDPmannose 4,6-dehydratase